MEMYMESARRRKAKKLALNICISLLLVGCTSHDKMATEPYAWKLETSLNKDQRLRNIEKRIEALEIEIEVSQETQDKLIYNGAFARQKRAQTELSLLREELEALQIEKAKLLEK